MNLYDPNQIQSLLARHGFRFSRSMGQNFLIDPKVTAAIAEAAGLDARVGVLEIGPGIGVLTAALAPHVGRLAAIELDRSLFPILRETLAGLPNVELVSGDVLKLDLAAFVRDKLPGLRPVVCANLPYNITTPVLTALIRSGVFNTMVLLVQLEVAQRICDGPEGAYGAFSVFVNYYYESETVLTVPPESFIPAPKVRSAVMRLRRRAQPPQTLVTESEFFRVVNAAFALRRKTLVNSLLAVYGSECTKEELREAVLSAGFLENIRGEALDSIGFARIAWQLRKKSSNN